MKTVPITTQTMHKFCRTCLSKLKPSTLDRHNIHNLNLSQWLVVAASLVVDGKDDSYPKFLCRKCYEELQRFDTFRAMSQRSLRVFTDVIAQQQRKKKKVAEITEDNTEKRDDSFGNQEWLEFDYEKEKERREAGGEDVTHPNRCESEDESDKSLILSSHMDNKVFIKEAADYKTEYATVFGNTADFEIEETKFEFNGTQALEKETDVPDVTSPSISISSRQNVSTDIVDKEIDAMSETSGELFIPKKITPKRATTRAHKRSVVTVPSAVKTAMKRIRYCMTRAAKELTEELEEHPQQKKLKQKHPAKKLEGKFECDECPRRCISKENLDCHKRTHQGLRPFACKQCDRAYNKAAHLRDHIRECHNETPRKFVCAYEGCSRVFQRESSYKCHYRLKHSDRKPETKTYICEDCGRTFKNITTLRDHRYKHFPESEYPYHCEQCSKHFTSQRTYKEHQMRHAGIKNYECSYCGMRKTTRNELVTHMNYHTKEKQYPCQKCSSVFNSSNNLGMHDKIVHQGIRRFQCRFCDQSFGKSDTLKYHEMRHTGEKPHECNICGKRFIQPVALRAHLKTHSKDAEAGGDHRVIRGGNGANKRQAKPDPKDSVTGACVELVKTLKMCQ